MYTQTEFYQSHYPKKVYDTIANDKFWKKVSKGKIPGLYPIANQEREFPKRHYNHITEIKRTAAPTYDISKLITKLKWVDADINVYDESPGEPKYTNHKIHESTPYSMTQFIEHDSKDISGDHYTTTTNKSRINYSFPGQVIATVTKTGMHQLYFRIIVNPKAKGHPFKLKRDIGPCKMWDGHQWVQCDCYECRADVQRKHNDDKGICEDRKMKYKECKSFVLTQVKRKVKGFKLYAAPVTPKAPVIKPIKETPSAPEVDVANDIYDTNISTIDEQPVAVVNEFTGHMVTMKDHRVNYQGDQLKADRRIKSFEIGRRWRIVSGAIDELLHHHKLKGITSFTQPKPQAYPYPVQYDSDPKAKHKESYIAQGNKVKVVMIPAPKQLSMLEYFNMLKSKANTEIISRYIRETYYLRLTPSQVKYTISQQQEMTKLPVELQPDGSTKLVTHTQDELKRILGL